MTDLEQNIKTVRENLDTSRRNGAYPAWVALAEVARKADALTAENAQVRRECESKLNVAELAVGLSDERAQKAEAELTALRARVAGAIDAITSARMVSGSVESAWAKQALEALRGR